MDGIGAQVVIALGTTNLWEGFDTDPIELELDVPHAGTMRNALKCGQNGRA